MSETAVVTAFVEAPDGRILLLRRAPSARTYAGRWSGVSGYLEEDDAHERALLELAEETGLGSGDVELLGTGPPLAVAGEEDDRWLVYPFRFRCADPARIDLNEENAELVWIEPRELAERETVPGLADAYLHARFGDRIDAIANDRSRGASALAAVAVGAVAEAAELGLFPLELGRALAAARPSMGAVGSAVGRVLAAAREPDQVVAEAQGLLSARERAPRAIAVLLQPDLTGTVMTHSASATVREALLHSPPDRVVCTVSEPIGEGRGFSEELSAQGLTVELVADEDAEEAVSTVDLLLIGADTVFRDGSLANKTGTSSLCRGAREAGVPVVVACETIKLSASQPREPDEELFDLTPAGGIDRYVTEDGAFPSGEVHTLVDRTPFLREGHELLLGQASPAR